MARFRAFRRAGPFGVALTAYDIWRRIPKRQRQAILRQARKQARKHGPRIATRLMQGRRRP